MTQPKVSVLVAVYNIEDYLGRSLESVAQQTLEDIEVILVDDGSEDSSANICDYYASHYPHFKVIHKENGGLASARNAGIDMARGEYMYFMDGDDWIESNLLEESYHIISEDSYDVLIFGHVKEYQTSFGTNYISTIPPKIQIRNRDELRTELVRIMNSGNSFAVWEQMYHTEFIRKNNLRFPDYKRGSDMAFLCVLYSNVNSIITNPKAYYHYLAFPSHLKWNPQLLNDHLDFYQKFLAIHNWFDYDKNRDYSLKLLLLWFCHVIPTNIIRNDSFPNSEKRRMLGEVLTNSKLSQWLDMFNFGDAKGLISIVMFCVLKSRSSLVLYCFTNFKDWLKSNMKIDYKNLFYR